METWEEDGELYGQFFLYNNEMNEAGDPINFQVHAENNEKIAKSFIGRPYVVLPKVNGKWQEKHIRADTLDKVLNVQKKYSLGEIVRTPFNSITGNHNAVVKFFREHYDRIKKGDIPPATSPMLAHTKSYFDDEGRLHIEDGIGVHLHGVPKGGYPPELSEVKSICKGGLDECMNELKIVAAAGELSEYQKQESFSKGKNQGIQLMSMEQPAQAPPGGQPQQGQDSEARIAALEKGMAELQKLLQELVAKISGGAPAAPPGAGMPGAAGEQGAVVTETPDGDPSDTASIRAELAQIKAEREVEKESLQKEREALALQERTRIATEIVENKIKLHRLPLEARDTEIQKLVALKTADDQPADLTLLATEIRESLKMLVGASGNFGLPELTLDEPEANPDIDHVSVMEEIGA